MFDIVQYFKDLESKTTQTLIVVLGICLLVLLFKAVCCLSCRPKKKQRDIKKIIERKMTNSNLRKRK